MLFRSRALKNLKQRGRLGVAFQGTKQQQHFSRSGAVFRTGIGTLIAMMLPYSVTFLICWSLFFYFWVFVLGLPVGPAAPTNYG